MNYTKNGITKICNSVLKIFIRRNRVNIVFIEGKIISNIEFKFIINSKNISIAIFEVELLNKSIVKIKAYNKLADYCYSRLNKKDVVFIEGHLSSSIEIIIKTLKKSE